MGSANIFKHEIILVFKMTKRVASFALRIVILSLSRIYIWLSVIPYLIIHEGLSKSFVIKFTFNSIVVLERRRVFKVALNKKSTIGLEFNNFEKIRELHPYTLDILPDYNMKRNKFISYLSAPRYEIVNLPDSLELATRIFELMRECHKPEVRLQIIETAELAAGLSVISQIYGESIRLMIQHFVDLYLKSGKYHIGLAHGDFHSRNIVIDEYCKPRIIDLDCVRFCGIQELDAFYFLMEQEWSESGSLWYETIVEYFKGDIPDKAIAVLNRFGVDYCHGLAVTYLVDRVGQEKMNYGFKYTDLQLAPAINEILFISTSMASAYSQVH